MAPRVRPSTTLRWAYRCHTHTPAPPRSGAAPAPVASPAPAPPARCAPGRAAPARTHLSGNTQARVVEHAALARVVLSRDVDARLLVQPPRPQLPRACRVLARHVGARLALAA